MPKKIPVRMCTGCGEMKPKMELIRIVKNKDGEISADFIGKANGRGAYICKSKECFEKALKTKRLEKAFGMSIPETISNQIRKELEANA